MENEVSKNFIKSVKNEYARNWKRKNRDKVRKTQEKYWTKKAQEKMQNLQ